MAFQIPDVTDRQFVQDNKTDVGGNLWSTFNVDLTDSYGKLKTTRTKLVTNSDDEADLELPVGFAFYNGNHYAVTDDYVYRGGNSATDDFSIAGTGDLDAPDSGLSEANSDIEVFDGRLVTFGSDTLYWYDGNNWNNDTYGSITSNSPHLLESYASRLYMTDNFDKVVSFDDSSTPILSSSGSNTLDLGLGDDYVITMLEKGESRLWIGVLALGGGKGIVYEWDGENENSPSAQYYLDSPGVIGGIVGRGEQAPTILDAEGKLLKWNGAGFEEVARLPLDQMALDSIIESSNLRFMHPNGIVENDGNIQMLIKSEINDSSTIGEGSTPQRCPSGVWEYNQDIGLYHKYSISYSEDGDTGTTNVTDYGQHRFIQAGALFPTRRDNFEAQNQPDFLIGTEYATDGGMTSKFGIFVDEDKRETQEQGYFVTPQLFAGGIEDVWAKVYLRYRRFLNDSDQIVVKYRTVFEDPIEADINWVDSTSFTTTDDISEVEEGYEIEFLQGQGSGDYAHVEKIETSSGNTYTVTMDEDIVAFSDSAKVRFTNWEKASVTEGDTKDQTKEVTIGETGPYIQFKIIIRGTGDNEYYDTTIVNSEHVKPQ